MTLRECRDERMIVEIDNIPHQLKERPQWVLWRWEQRRNPNTVGLFLGNPGVIPVVRFNTAVRIPTEALKNGVNPNKQRVSQQKFTNPDGLEKIGRFDV